MYSDCFSLIHNVEKVSQNASQYSPQCLMNKIKTFVKSSNYSSEEKNSMIKELINEVKKLNFLGETEEKVNNFLIFELFLLI